MLLCVVLVYLAKSMQVRLYVYLCLGLCACTAVEKLPSPPEMRQVSYQGVELNYARRSNPAAPLLFFIHGAPGDWEAYSKYLDDSLLSADFHMISVDRPGYGSSASGRIVASVAEQSRMLSEVLRPFVKKQAVILIGHSYGGPIALRMAIDHPDWVDGILLLAPAIDPGLEKRGKWRVWLRKVPLRWLVPQGLYVANEEIIHLKADLEEMEVGYSWLKLPVYYIHGTGDMLVPVENQYYARQQMKHLPLRVRILKRVNHFIPWTHYDEVIAGIRHLEDALAGPVANQQANPYAVACRNPYACYRPSSYSIF